jgi:chromosome segregation ATPase
MAEQTKRDEDRWESFSKKEEERWETHSKQEATKWDEMMESIDLIFAKMTDMGNHQDKIEAKVDMSNKVMEQMIKDQERITKQLASNGQAIAQLRMKQRDLEEPLSPTYSEIGDNNAFQPGQPHHHAGGSKPRNHFGVPKKPMDEK